MRDIQTMIVGTDFSHAANAALTYGIVFAKKFGARLDIVAVYDPVHLVMEMLPEVDPIPSVIPGRYPSRETLENALEDLAAMAEAQGVRARIQIKDGRAYVRLIQVAKELQAGMVIVGTRGLVGIDHLFIGSTAEQLVRMAPCPVLTVRDIPPEFESAMDEGIRRILVPIDFSPYSQEAEEFATPLAEHFDADVYLVHVQEPHFYGLGSLRLTTRAAAHREVRTHLAEWMDELVAMFRKRGLAAHSEIREGVPANEIIDAAKNVHADLIVMGTHGRTGLSHTLVGSIAEKVVRRAPCPVLTVKSPKFQFVPP